MGRHTFEDHPAKNPTFNSFGLASSLYGDTKCGYWSLPPSLILSRLSEVSLKGLGAGKERGNESGVWLVPGRSWAEVRPVSLSVEVCTQQAGPTLSIACCTIVY